MQRLEVRLYDEYVMAGNTAVLRCVVPSFINDLVTVTAWEKDGTLRIYPAFEGDGKHHALPDGRLLVFDVKASDSFASYSCRAAHQITLTEAQSNTAKIIVSDSRERVAPQIVTKQELLKVKSEASVIVPCVAHAHPPPKYRWFLNRKGNVREPLMSHKSRTTYHLRKQLMKDEILYLTPDHEALRHTPRHPKVICEAYNEVGSAVMEVAIEREYAVSVEISPKVLVLDTSSNGEMHCRVSGGHGSKSITWYKDGQLLVPNGAAIAKDDGMTLEIRRASRQDAGMYQCFVSIQEKVYQAAAELRLGASPPEFLYRFIQQTLTPGPAASLKCISSGSPTPTISWTLDGFSLPQSDRIMMGQYVSLNGEVISHVNISRTRVEDGGIFACSAKNTAGSITHSAPLYIYGPPHVRDIGSLTAVAGEKFKVRCPVAGYPIPAVSWTKGGRELPLNRRQEISGAELNIYKVNRGSDEGQYICTASDRQGRVAAKTLHLRVVEPPKVAPFMLPRSLTAGSRVAVQCVLVQGDPPVELQWFHNHRLAHKVPGVTVTPLGQFVLALVIDRVTPMHAGNYTCTVTSHRAEISDSHSSVLHVHVPPIIKSFDFGELISGMRTQVTCLVQTGDPPIRISWLQNGSPLLATSDVMIRQMDTFSSSLIFSNVKASHVGNYTCVAANDAKEVRYTAELLVRVSPHWKAEPKDVSVIKGDDVLLDCLAEGFPTPTITWRRVHRGRKQNIFHHSFNSGMDVGQTLENGSLLLNDVNEETEGSFLCEVSNGVGTDLSSMAYVNVQVPPSVKGQDKLEIRKGDFVAIKCQAIGDSPLTLSIAKDGQPIDAADSRYSITITDNQINEVKQIVTNSKKTEGVRQKNAELKLSKVETKDSGEFACTATNPYGSHTHLTNLVVQDVPEAPRNLRLVNEGSRFVTISWTPSLSPSAPILSYIIRSKKTDELWESSNTKKIHVRGKALSADIKNLLPSSTYQVKIAAVNSVGESPSSEALTVHTKGESPSAPPQNVRAIPLSSSKIKVEWSPPDPKSWHGALNGYFIGYREENSKNSKDYVFEKAKPSTEKPHSWTIDGLKKYTRYEFVVQAVNALGPGPLSREVHATTHEDVPEAAPEDVSCLSLTSKSLEVSWSPPPPDLTHGKIISYAIIYTSLENYFSIPPKETHVLSGKTTILSNLSPYTNYSITVAALTKAGTGVESNPITCITEEDVPEAPKDVKCLVAGPNEVVVAWSDPLHTNGVLTKFTVYIQTSRSHEIKRRMVPAQSHYYEVSTLMEGEEVQVWLTASTRVGEGDPTKTVSALPSQKVQAGIKAVDNEIRVPQGSDVMLECPYLGDPTPTVMWRMDDVLIEKSSRWKRQPDGGLLLHDSNLEHSGNYSCQVVNIHGTDRILYNLIVMVPPRAPRLRSLGSTTDSVTMTWQLGDDGGSPIEKLTLTWRPDREEWKEEVLQGYTSSYTLKNLSCGTSYHLYLTPQNAIGPGSESEMVSVRTKGERPTTPPQHRVITVNASSVMLNLLPFSDPECPVTEFYINLKPSSSQNWITAKDKLSGNQHEYVVTNLLADMEYEMEVTASNSAGETMTRYSFKTLPTLGDLKDVPHGRKREQEWLSSTDLLWRDPTFIIPIILSCIAFVAIFISVIICIRRKATTSASKAPQNNLDPKTSLKREAYIPNEHQYYPTIKKSSTSPSRDVESVDTAPEYAEDIYPYATFQVQQQNDGSTLQTLVFQDPRKTSIHTVAYRKQDGMDRKSSHGRSLSSGSDYARVRRVRRRGTSYGGVESEESISDTDTDLAPSIMTESSSRIDGRNAHNLLYLTSDASTIPSPPSERKRLPSQSTDRMNCDESSQDRIYGISAIRDTSRLPPSLFSHPPGQKSPAIPFSRRRKESNDGLEYSETECDRDSRRRSSKGPVYTFAV